MKKIDFCNYDENGEEDKDKWEVDYDGEFSPFFDAISNKKNFDDNRYNPVYMVGEGHFEVEDQAGKFVSLSNDKIDVMEKDDLYAEILQRGIK